MAVVYLVLFAAVNAAHLYFSKKNDQYGRGITKGMILLLLLGFYLESISLISAEPAWTLVAALLFSWLGDLLLLGKGLKWFTAGGISFIVSHLLFALTYALHTEWQGVRLWISVPVPVLFAAAVVFIFSKLKQFLPKQMKIPMFLYLMANALMNCFAIMRLAGKPTPGSAITAVGAMLFFISDVSLFFVRFNKDSRMKSHFLAMLTYAAGELLIVAGLIGA